MSTRLQILMREEELEEIRRHARREGMTVSEWVRQTLRSARRSSSSEAPEPRLAAVRAAARHEFPTGDIDDMLAEIERGYGAS